MQNYSNENEFDLHKNGCAGETHFHMNGFTHRLVLTQRQKVTWKWIAEYDDVQLWLEFCQTQAPFGRPLTDNQLLFAVLKLGCIPICIRNSINFCQKYHL